ncbi:MAG TPA: hypothetical protein VI193_10000 [Acidimicrobiia bacterium]
MSHQAGNGYDGPPAMAIGAIMFAGIMMMMSGVFSAFSGIVALAKDDFYVVLPNYLLELDPTTWGYVHLVLGIVVALAGFFVLTGRTWARVIGIIVALVSAIANFGFIPFYPVWSLLIIAVDIVVIWALAAHGRAMSQA